MDKIKVYPQERLDIVDVDALQTLVYTYVQEAIGSLIGPARGCLSQPSVTFIDGTPDKISLSDFSFIASKSIGNSIFTNKTKYNNFASQVVKFDSTLLDHGNYPISLTGVDNTMFLWARPLMVDTDLGNRRKWDVAQGSEVTFSDETRTRMRVEFAFSATDPTITGDDFQYSPIAKVTNITGSLINLTFISAFDSADIQAVTGESGTFYDSLNTNATAFSGMLPTYRLNDANVNTGLLSVVHALGRMVRQMHAKGENDPSGTSAPLQWYNTQPKISLNGAYKALQNNDIEIANIYTNINNVENNITNSILPKLPDENIVPFGYWIISGNPLKTSPKWAVLRGTTTTLRLTSVPCEFMIDMNDDMITNGYFVNGCSVEQVYNPAVHGGTNLTMNRVSTQFFWKSEATTSSVWEYDTGRPVFRFTVIPWELTTEDQFDANDDFGTNLASNKDIILMITLFGKRV